MIKNTFCHIPSIGASTEQKLWDAGAATWDDFLCASCEKMPVSKNKAGKIQAFIQESNQRLNTGDAAWFAQQLPTNQAWRLFDAFRDGVVYLDIETTGLTPPSDHVTTIATYDGKEVRYYVHGRNLDDFVRDIKDYTLLVSFNGKCFDVPFLESQFDISIDKAHMDLRFVLKALGLKGGLKKCERHFGLDRGELDGVDGYDAVLLWREFRNTGDERALETLLAYNIEDVINLEVLAVRAYNELLRNTPFASTHVLPEPQPALNPVPSHRHVLDKIKSRYY